MTTPLRFATFLAPNMAPVYRFLAGRIGRRLGRRVELVVGRSFDQFQAGEVDLGVICRLPYVWLAARCPSPVEPMTAPILSGARYGGRPVYYSDVIVRHDSPISCLEELRPLLGLQRAVLPLRPHRHPLQPGRMGVRRLPRPGGRGRLPPAGHPPGRRRQRGRRCHRLPGPGHRAARPPTAGRRPAGGRRLRALDHPAGGGRQPPPGRMEARGAGAAGLPRRRPDRPAGAGSRPDRGLRRGRRRRL
jgi:hypothetical protein